tara:strand:+ start:2333 stop:2560 length:228 start_codon:yes stop_codon:yes gene_type:complete
MKKPLMTIGLEEITKEEWLGRLMTCSENGKRATSLADAPLIVMTRKQSFDKQELDDESIDTLYKETIKKLYKGKA